MQTYKCIGCGYKFQQPRRKDKFLKKLWRQYIWQRQTYADLNKKHQRGERWAQRKLDQIKIKPVVKLNPGTELILVADTTFFSRSEGITVFREPNLKKIVWWRQTWGEKAEIYKLGKEHLEKNGFKIKAVVLDGRTGIKSVFNGIPVQMCHFHQKRIINKYLTARPKLPAGIELREIARTIPHSHEEELSKKLTDWFLKWEQFLKQKTTDSYTGRWFHTYKRIRSAYRSLTTNLPYLYTYQKYPDLNIPNTTNSLDGYFNHLKSLLNVHRGLSPQRRYQMITEIFAGR